MNIIYPRVEGLWIGVLETEFLVKFRPITQLPVRISAHFTADLGSQLSVKRKKKPAPFLS